MLEIVLLPFPMIKNLVTDDYIGFLSCRLLCKLMIKLGTFGSLKAECDLVYTQTKVPVFDLEKMQFFCSLQ